MVSKLYLETMLPRSVRVQEGICLSRNFTTARLFHFIICLIKQITPFNTIVLSFLLFPSLTVSFLFSLGLFLLSLLFPLCHLLSHSSFLSFLLLNTRIRLSLAFIGLWALGQKLWTLEAVQEISGPWGLPLCYRGLSHFLKCWHTIRALV